MATYYLSGNDSDLSGGTRFDKQLVKSTESAGTLSVETANDSTETSFVYTNSGTPSNDDWETAGLGVEVNVTTGSSAVSLRVRATRISSDGTVQESTAWTGSQTCSAGLLTFSIGSHDWSAGNCDDRLRIDYEFTSTNSHGGNEIIELETGTTDTEHTTSITEFGGSCFPAYVDNLSQYDSDHDTPISEGGSTQNDNVYLDFDVNAVDPSSEAVPKLENESTGTAFDGTATHQDEGLTPEVSSLPTGRRGGSFVYDSQNRRYVYFGGYDGTTRFNETWELGVDTEYPFWKQLSPGGTPPSGRNLHAAWYDSGNQRMIVFGGFDGGDVNDMFELDLTQGSESWSQLSPSGDTISARSYILHSTGVDDANSTAYLFGGWGASRFNDLYEIDYSTSTPAITQLSADGAAGAPAGRSGPVVVHDASNGRVIIHGGYDGTSYLNDTWEWNISGGSFNELSPGGTLPTGRELASGRMDAGNQRLIVIGGWQGGTSSMRNDVWELDLTSGSESFTQLRADSDDQALDYHASAGSCVNSDDNILLVGMVQTPDFTEKFLYGIDLGDTTSSPAVYGINFQDYFRRSDAASFDYNPDRSELVITGGFGAMDDGETIGNGAHLSSVWAFDHADNYWRFAGKGPLSFTPREGSLQVYDSTNSRFIMFGGLSSVQGMTNDVWELKADEYGNYKATELNPTGTKPQKRWLVAGAYDLNNNRVVLWSGEDEQTGTVFTDVWELSFANSTDGEWSELTPSGTAPSGTWGMMDAYDDTNNLLYVFGGSASASDGTYQNTLHSLDLTNSTPVWTTLSSGATARRSGVMGHDGTNGQLVLFGGYDGTNVLADLYYYDIAGDTWTGDISLSTEPDARRSHVGGFFNGKFYIATGRPTSGQWYNDTWELTPDYATTSNSSWSQLSPRIYNRADLHVTGLTEDDYHWQAWATASGSDSEKMSFGTNTESDADYTIGSAGTDVTDEQSAEITGSQSASAERSAEVSGQQSDNDERSAEVSGSQSVTSERSAEITGDQDNASERSGEVTGSDSVNAERSAELTGDQTVNAERAAEISGTDTEASERGAEVSGYQAASAERQAEITGQDSDNSERQAEIIGGQDVDAERSAEVLGQQDDADERGGEISGTADDSDEVAAEIEGSQSPTSERGAEIIGDGAAEAQRSAEVSGTDDTSDERGAEVSGEQDDTAQRGAEISGGQDVTDEISAEVSGTADADDQRGARISGFDTAGDQRPAEISGSQTADSQRPGEISGVDDASDERSAEVIGGQTVSDERSAEVSGTADTQSQRSAEISGGTAENDERSAEVSGTDDTQSDRAGEVSGSQTDNDQRSAEISGDQQDQDERSAEVMGFRDDSDERSVEITGKDQASDEVSAEISGVDDRDNERSAEIEGEGGSSSNRGAEVTGSDTESDERSAEIVGGQTVTDERSAEVSGVDSDTAERAGEISGNADDSEDRPAEVMGSDSASSERSAELVADQPEQSERGAEITGIGQDDDERQAEVSGAQDDTAERAAVVDGKETVSDDRDAEVSGRDTDTDERGAEVVGGQDDSNEVSAEISGIDSVDDSRSAEITGFEQFMGGRETVLGTEDIDTQAGQRDTDTQMGTGDGSVSAGQKDTDTTVDLGMDDEGASLSQRD